MAPPPGERVEVRLTGLSKKGKWQFEIAGRNATGTIVAGAGPTDAEVGQTRVVQIIRATTRSNIEASWGDAC